MCRHLAYVGPAIGPASLLTEPEHSLEHQSHAPRHQVLTTVNADGWGIAWYAPEIRPEPARYRTTKPIWADRSFASIAGVLRTPALLAAARSATPPLPVDESANAPFVDGPWAGSLNGFVGGFRGPAGVELRNLVSPRRAALLEGNNDGELLCALAWDRLDPDGSGPGPDPLDALESVVHDAERLGPGPKNLLLTDGRTILATAVGNSLFTLVDAGLAAGGAIVASEPLDDHPDWQPVPDRHLLAVEGTALRLRGLAAP